MVRQGMAVQSYPAYMRTDYRRVTNRSQELRFSEALVAIKGAVDQPSLRRRVRARPASAIPRRASAEGSGIGSGSD